MNEPSLEAVSEAVAALLREQEIGTLATVDEWGCPSASTMHIAADDATVYVHTFTYNRKYAEMLREPRVSYAVTHTTSFEKRFETYSLQMKGVATLLTTPAEIETAVRVSREQFPWLADVSMYDNVKTPDQGQQAFFRIDPVSALWSDNRVRLMWRTMLEFDAAGKATEMTPYNAVVGRRSR